jgi:hypothetical protein
MCFRESELVQRVLFERLDWQRVDEEFVAEHLATLGSLPGITADWVPSLTDWAQAASVTGFR